MHDARSNATKWDHSPQVSLLAVIVVYKHLPGETSSLKTLLEARCAALPANLRLSILIFDNTPGGQDPGDLPEDAIYHAFPHNPGLAEPYNEALAHAKQQGFSWLLTLDQDTSLPSNFFASVERHISANECAGEVAAIVPQISDHGRIISPFRFVGGFLPRVLPAGTKGISKRFTSALNSGCVFRVSTLLELDGYDRHFPLHNSDSRMFQKIDQAGKRVFIARDVLVDHELAILQRQERLTYERYRKLLEDECDFWDRHMGVLGRIERFLRLAARVCKGMLQSEDPGYRSIAAKEMWRRLTVPRKKRIRNTGQIAAT